MLAAPYLQEERLQEQLRLLVLDADADIHALLQQSFQHDYHLVFVDTAAQVKNALQQQSIDLILIDVTVPEINGLEVLRQLRAAPCRSMLPVILISAVQDSSAAVQGLQLGANDYVTKPLDVEGLRARITTQMALKQGDNEREQTIAQLKFTQEMQENFTRIISHDLKGPVTNIRMAQFMLRDILHDNEEARSILDNMDATLNGMVEMIRVFLEAMDSQQLDARLEPLEIHDLIVEIIEQYRLSADRKQIRLTMHDCDRRVIADQHLMRQVLSNLISNAIKFSPPGAQTSVWTEGRDGMVRICIADEGPGIPPEERGKLFNMFGKASTRPTAGETSTGLGLWIVRELTQLQGGQVGVDQTAEGGALFWIELPSAAPSA